MKLFCWFVFLFVIDCVISIALFVFVFEQTQDTLNCIVEVLP